jgi:hypothetical protein
MAGCHLRERRLTGAAHSRLSGNCRHLGRNGPRDLLPGHSLARHIDDFLTDLANANKPRSTIRTYRGDLVAFAAHHDGEVTGTSCCLTEDPQGTRPTPPTRVIIMTAARRAVYCGEMMSTTFAGLTAGWLTRIGRSASGSPLNSIATFATL